jgi:hypothetical protein
MKTHLLTAAALVTCLAGGLEAKPITEGAKKTFLTGILDVSGQLMPFRADNSTA